MINTDSIKIVHKKPQNYNDITESSTIMSNDSYSDEYTNTNNKICKKIHNNIIKEINNDIERDNEIKIKNNIFILFFEYLKQNYDSKQDLNELIDNFIEIYSLDQNDNTYIKCIKTNKLIIITFLVSLTIGICFVIFMYNK